MLMENKKRLTQIEEKAAKKEDESKDYTESLNKLRDELAKNAVS